MTLAWLPTLTSYRRRPKAGFAGAPLLEAAWAKSQGGLLDEDRAQKEEADLRALVARVGVQRTGVTGLATVFLGMAQALLRNTQTLLTYCCAYAPQTPALPCH